MVFIVTELRANIPINTVMQSIAPSKRIPLFNRIYQESRDDKNMSYYTCNTGLYDFVIENAPYLKFVHEKVIVRTKAMIARLKPYEKEDPIADDKIRILASHLAVREVLEELQSPSP